jgi:predicted DNA-binding transcriptional regulator AlpA
MTFQPYRSIVRMPKQLPAFKAMLEDIGNPHPRELAKALHVTERSVWRWLSDDSAPHSVRLAIYWLTRWGVSEIDCEAHNAAILSAGLARAFKDELEALKVQVVRIGKLGNFGCSNDPGQGFVIPPPAPLVDQKWQELAVENVGKPSSTEELKTELNQATMRVAAG